MPLRDFDLYDFRGGCENVPVDHSYDSYWDSLLEDGYTRQSFASPFDSSPSPQGFANADLDTLSAADAGKNQPTVTATGNNLLNSYRAINYSSSSSASDSHRQGNILVSAGRLGTVDSQRMTPWRDPIADQAACLGSSIFGATTDLEPLLANQLRMVSSNQGSTSSMQEPPISPITEERVIGIKRDRDAARADSHAVCGNSSFRFQQGTDSMIDLDPATCSGNCTPLLFSELPQSPLAGTSSWDQMTGGGRPRISKRPCHTRRRDRSADSVSDRDTTPAARAQHQPGSEAKPQPGRDRPLLKRAQEPEPKEEATKPASSHNKGRTPHHQIERKYRESINTQIESLRRAIPFLQPQHHSRDAGSSTCDGDGGNADMEDPATASALYKRSKAEILSGATSYIKQLERERDRVLEANESLKVQMEGIYQLVGARGKPRRKCGVCEILG
ncbi:hypothetical protein NA57DRAFT_76766 [Rhizodiscina lignyota]|uniref:BHLH domain-containing protein n=1 Tax=Rhizodiscina lignyota TaxID=1504668 RepID=A0A9P4IGB7_9PEZI|nr:hypothetical protein NA57DRAFT_76766 [Rhizodiscina lignyota]